MSLVIQRESVESLTVTYQADRNVSADAVAFAVVPLGNRPTTWVAGTWTSTAGSGTSWVFTATTPTIGAAGAQIPLTPGAYAVFMRVTDNPDVPVEVWSTLTVA